MKRLARIVAVIGGIGALVWAMRERLVSVAISREPVPPAIQVPDDDHPPLAAVPAGTITDVSGIGPVYATRLGSIGVNSLFDLAEADAATVAEGAQVPISRAREWITAAADLIVAN